MAISTESTITQDSKLILKIQVFRSLMNGVIIFAIIDLNNGNTMDYLYIPLNISCINLIIEKMTKICNSVSHAMISSDITFDVDDSMNNIIGLFIRNLSNIRLEYLNDINITFEIF